MTIATLYAPNDDDPNFFLNFFDHLNDFQCDEVIIGGDLNLVLGLDMDKKGGLAKTHTESVKILKDFCAQFELLDAWRVSILTLADIRGSVNGQKFNAVLISFSLPKV